MPAMRRLASHRSDDNLDYYRVLALVFSLQGSIELFFQANPDRMVEILIENYSGLVHNVERFSPFIIYCKLNNDGDMDDEDEDERDIRELSHGLQLQQDLMAVGEEMRPFYGASRSVTLRYGTDFYGMLRRFTSEAFSIWYRNAERQYQEDINPCHGTLHIRATSTTRYTGLPGGGGGTGVPRYGGGGGFNSMANESALPVVGSGGGGVGPYRPPLLQDVTQRIIQNQTRFVEQCLRYAFGPPRVAITDPNRQVRLTITGDTSEP